MTLEDAKSQAGSYRQHREQASGATSCGYWKSVRKRKKDGIMLDGMAHRCKGGYRLWSDWTMGSTS